MQCTDAIQPASVMNASLPSLRACGLSERKASYLIDLAEHFEHGSLSNARIAGKLLGSPVRGLLLWRSGVKITDRLIGPFQRCYATACLCCLSGVLSGIHIQQ